MSLIYSYSIGLETKKIIGTGIANKHSDSINSLYQAVDNTLPKGTVFKLDVELLSAQSRTIDLSNLGLSYIRSLFLKCENKFGYCLKSSTQMEDPYWHLTKTVFLDFNLKPTNVIVSSVDPKYRLAESLTTLKLESPAATHPIATIQNPQPVNLIQIIVVGDS